MASFSISHLKFMPGLELNRRYFFEVLQPLLSHYHPDLKYSACLIGYGSDVLGYDTPISMDHNWGPRGQLFLSAEDVACIPEIDQTLRRHLPPAFLGFPTHFSDKRADHTQSMIPCTGNEVNHLVEIYDLDAYLDGIFHKKAEEFTALDWLRLPEQELLEFTTGEVFYDGLERLNGLRTKFNYYPADVRLIKLAAYWNHIANEEAFVGRAVERADFIGAKLISTRLLNTLLKICFVLKERYVPYSKWFTRGFADLGLDEIEAAAANLLQENEPQAIENRLAGLYVQVLDLQNHSAGIPLIKADIVPFYNRPFKVIMAERIIDPLREAIRDEQIRTLELTEVGLDNRIDGIDLNNGQTLKKIFPLRP